MSDYPTVKYASSDHIQQTGLVYQGLADTEHIYLNKEQLSIQGKQKGSVNLVDYNNDGNADLFTTGFYLNKEGQEVADTTLYQSLQTETGTFPHLKYSASCWADFDNNGFLEPAMIGQDNNGKSHFDIFNNNHGTISPSASLTGLKYGDLECVDINKDSWTDLVACGQDEQGNAVSAYFQNIEGTFQLSQNLHGVSYCSISVNDFNQDGFADVVIAGEDTNYQSFFHLYTYDGREFTKTNIENIEPLKLAVLDSGDFNNDGMTDIILSGSQKVSQTALLENMGGTFQKTLANLIQVQDGAVQFLDYDQDNQLELFITGIYSDGIDERYDSQLLSFDTAIKNTPPSVPSGLKHEGIGSQYLKLAWEKTIDDHSEHLFYHVRAGTHDNPDQFLSGYLSNEKGNAQLAEFKILKNPCLSEIDAFFFQVMAIDSSFAISEWSEPYEITCQKASNDTEIKPADNNTVMPQVPETTEQAPERWTHTRYFGKLKYRVDYERLEDFVLVTEIITNQDVYIHENVSITHIVTELYDQGSYSMQAIGRIEHFQKQLAPGQKRYLSFRLKPMWSNKDILSTQITSQPIVPPKSIRKTINVSTIVKENKTIVQFQAKVNDSNLLEKDVVVIQTLPKCLIERINELAIRSGKIKSNRKFIIMEEDPVIMWTFDTITDPEQLKLEIQAVADEDCRNQIKTEIVAKKYLARNIPINPLAVFLQIVIPVLLFALLSAGIKFSQRTVRHRKIGHIVLLIISLIFIVSSLLDTFQLLPASLDFLKKVLAWFSILLLIVHLDMARLLTGLPKNTVKFSHVFFNICLITGFTCLSIKNIVFMAFETYGQETIFSDLLILIIKYARTLETTLFFAGTVLVLTAILFGWLRLPFMNHSIAEIITQSDSVIYSKHMIRKLLLVTVLILGFYTAIFHFLFDWFSIGIDAPLLLLLMFFSYKAMAKPDIEEISIQKYLQMFTHRENKWIALSFFPVLIFIVEAYLSVFYWLTAQKNLYLKAVNVYLPTLRDVFHNSSWPVWGIYLLQIIGLVSVMIYALVLWWQYFRKSQDNQLVRNHLFPRILSILTILGLVSYLLKPVFSVVSLENSKLSGVLLILKDRMAVDNISLHYMIIMGVFGLFLFVRNTKWPQLLSKITTLLSVAIVTVLFLLSYLIRMIQPQQSVFPENISIVILLNSFFLMILAAVYAVILIVSLFAWCKLLFFNSE